MVSKPRLRLLGAEVDVVTPEEVLAFTADCAGVRKKAVVANHNAHSLYLVGRTPQMRAFYDRADLIEIDSIPMIAWGRFLGADVSRRHRSTYLDWREAFWTRAAAEGWRVYHLGCAPGVGEAARAAIHARHSNVEIGVRHGFFDPDGSENDRIVDEIRAFDPHVLLVGMGMPRQEAWIEANYERLPPAVIFPIGAAFDFEAGKSKTPPRWTGRMGLEWLHRFAHEPKRLFSRYFVEPWSLIGPAVVDLRRALARPKGLEAVP
jgi:N-acetylglucosaminyldiphosphoundecaprenol N-acetyl-beta-D-mannosaminyltransferase